jgi:hypothetical protein
MEILHSEHVMVVNYQSSKDTGKQTAHQVYTGIIFTNYIRRETWNTANTETKPVALVAHLVGVCAKSTL